MAHDRREFLRRTALAAPVLGLSGMLQARKSYSPPDPNKKLRIAVIGSGLRGQSHIDLILRRTDCELVAIADPDPYMLASTKQLVEELKGKWPAVYDQGPHDYIRLLSTEKPDAVIIATPWEWHSQQAIAAMKAGAYTGMEVSGGFSLDECWEMVNVHEQTGTPLYFLENVCFRRDVMAIGNMVRKGLFGELIHLECGYQHDLRDVKFNGRPDRYEPGVEFGDGAYSEARWRTWHSVYRNGDLYPTHGIGPVSDWIHLNRGNRMESLVSMASKARGLHDYVVNHPKGGPDHPSAKVEFRLGDKVTTLIKCTNGETIAMHHDTNLPRPYSLGFRVQGTKGIWMDVNRSLLIEGVTPPHRWEAADEYLKTHDHPDWAAHEKDAEGAGHGGMDWFLMDSFVQSALAGKEPPYDVYDAASWMAITPMSEASIAAGGAPQAFPDFTRGKWMRKK